ncbi:MAG: sulfatase-like hydrolase/transferase [Akkermansiaceae bacterium]
MTRPFLKSLLLPLTLLGVNLASAADPTPNIIFIFADDWGWEDLSCHNHPFVKTPNIDRLSKEGTEFTRFTVASPVCSPSRTAINTGQFSARQLIDGHFAWADSNKKRGMPDWLDTQAPSMPRILQTAGYRTAHYGKWHLSNEMIPDSPNPLAYGYDAYGAYNCSGEQMPYDKDVFHSINFIKKSVAEKRPFFINLWLHEPHTPFHVLPKYRQMFPHLTNDGENIYAATLAYADERVGELLNYLDDNNLTENTLVIFSSDNGPARSKKPVEVPTMMYDPSTGLGFGNGASKGTTGGRKGYKGSLHEGGINVPFLARWPGKIKAGAIDTQSFITAVDILPTFCSLAGAKLPEGYVPDGLDYTDVLLGTPAPEREKTIFSRYSAGSPKSEHWASHTVISKGYKFLTNPKTKRTELYHLVSDPLEKKDLAAEKAELVTELKAELDTWLTSLPTEHPAGVFSSLRNDPKALQKSKEPYRRYR